MLGGVPVSSSNLASQASAFLTSDTGILPTSASSASQGSLPPVSSVTPLRADQFALELQHHPDCQLVNYVLDGISNGFQVGSSPSHKFKSAKNNKPSALQHAAVVDEYLAHEVSLGQVSGPFTPPPLYPTCKLTASRLFKRGGSQESGA